MSKTFLVSVIVLLVAFNGVVTTINYRLRAINDRVTAVCFPQPINNSPRVEI